jgi:hypothetical protein
MDERGSMRELNRDCRWSQFLEVVSPAFRGQEDQRRPDALSTRCEKIRHRGGNDIGILLDEASQGDLDGFEITRDRAEDALRFRL